MQRGAGTAGGGGPRDDHGTRDRRGARDQRGAPGERRTQRRGRARLSRGAYLTRAARGGAAQHGDDGQHPSTGGLLLSAILTRHRSCARRPVVRGPERGGDRRGGDHRSHRGERDRRPPGRTTGEEQTASTTPGAVRRRLGGLLGTGTGTVAEQALAGLAPELGEALGRLAGREGATHGERSCRRRGACRGGRGGARQQGSACESTPGGGPPRPAGARGHRRAGPCGEGQASRLSGAGCRARPRSGRPRSGSRGVPRSGFRPPGLGLARQVSTPTVVRQDHRPGGPDLVGQTHRHGLGHRRPGEGPGVPGLLVGDTPHHGRQPTTWHRGGDGAAWREGGTAGSSSDGGRRGERDRRSGDGRRGASPVGRGGHRRGHGYGDRRRAAGGRRRRRSLGHAGRRGGREALARRGGLRGGDRGRRTELRGRGGCRRHRARRPSLRGPQPGAPPPRCCDAARAHRLDGDGCGAPGERGRRAHAAQGAGAGDGADEEHRVRARPADEPRAEAGVEGARPGQGGRRRGAVGRASTVDDQGVGALEAGRARGARRLGCRVGRAGHEGVLARKPL